MSVLPKKRKTTMSDQFEARNWLDLPRDITAAIFSKLEPVEILKTLERVCTQWRDISKEPSLWRTINLDWSTWKNRSIEAICMRAVDLSDGGLIEISVKDFGSDKLLAHIADRSRHLKRLRLVNCCSASDEGLSKAVSQLTELEELEISYCICISPVALEAVCRCCPQLKSFKFNCNPDDYDDVISDLDNTNDKAALAIAQHLHQLHHLQLFGNNLTNQGLQAILDACPRLKSLDLRRCFKVKLMEGDLEKRLTEQIKHLQRPGDFFMDYVYYTEYHREEEDPLCYYFDIYSDSDNGFGFSGDIFSTDPHFYDPQDDWDRICC